VAAHRDEGIAGTIEGSDAAGRFGSSDRPHISARPRSRRPVDLCPGRRQPAGRGP
jgi:hypothetical protein